MKTGPETEKGLSTHATPVIPLLCLVGVVLLLSSVTPLVKYIFQHSHLHPIRLASIRVMIGFLVLLTITWLWDRRGLMSLSADGVLRLGFVGLFRGFLLPSAAGGP